MRRPFHTSAGVLTAAHQTIELAFGTGVIGQSAVGLVPAMTALLFETPKGQRCIALLAIAAVFASRKTVERHFQWMADESARNRRWWNRAWTGEARPAGGFEERIMVL